MQWGWISDVGCRMSLSIIDESDSYIQRFAYQIKQALKNYTHFGMEGGLDIRQEHEVLDSPVFHEIPFLKPLRGKAVRQLGTSGKGNHFVEFGELGLLPGNALGLPAKKYTALLAHSGSRGLGSAIAQHYTKLATDSCKLPRQAQQLAWLDMNTEAGQEYWLAMTLAGDYAKACHDRIHSNLLNALGLKAICVVENHHNYAWKDKLADGQEVIGKSASMLVPASHEEQLEEVLSLVKDGEPVKHFEARMLAKSGRILDMSLTISPIRNARGELIGISKIGRDIRGQKREEQRKNTFVAVVSHELKTPLTTITSYVQLLLRKASPEKESYVYQYGSKIQVQAKRMNSMIHDFLSLARMDAGDIPL